MAVRFYPFDSSCSRDLYWFDSSSPRDLPFGYSNKYFNYIHKSLKLFFDYTSVTHLLTFLRLFLPSVYFDGGGCAGPVLSV